MDTRQRIIEVLERGYLMSLAVSDEGGPWAADVIFTHDGDLNIYWMSDPEVRHSEAIHKSGLAAGTITVTNNGEKNELGIQFSGKAERIEGDRPDLILNHCAKRNKPAPAEGEDYMEGDSWYVLRPSKLELIDVENLGWDKAKIEL